eukprot:EG_transcript_23436
MLSPSNRLRSSVAALGDPDSWAREAVVRRERRYAPSCTVEVTGDDTSAGSVGWMTRGLRRTPTAPARGLSRSLGLPASPASPGRASEEPLWIRPSATKARPSLCPLRSPVSAPPTPSALPPLRTTAVLPASASAPLPLRRLWERFAGVDTAPPPPPPLSPVQRRRCPSEAEASDDDCLSDVEAL